ncbi:HD domain-containing protein [Shewanella corallii]|uniref:HD domain-containing protein n=1 Tax=Shewanella corallii TaxID=560080 RepID=A0ABT0N3E6_9GAMM|nr:HD domain-containing phosphohydrolase [Shewanella corallii]MCL2912966.1 HD domain-containing protein [Shewanella corallii]
MDEALNAAGFRLYKPAIPVPAAEGEVGPCWSIIKGNARLARLLNTPEAQLHQASLLTFFPGLDQRLKQTPNDANYFTLQWSDRHLFHFCRQGENLHFLLHSHGEPGEKEQCRRCRVFTPKLPEPHDIEQECVRLLGQLMSRMEVPFSYFHLVEEATLEFIPTYWLGNGDGFSGVDRWRKGEALSIAEFPCLLIDAEAQKHPCPAGGCCDSQGAFWWFEPVRYNGQTVAVIGGAAFESIKGDRRALLQRYALLIWLMRQVPQLEAQLADKNARVEALETGNHQMFRQLINVVSEALELKDAYTANHQRSVAELAVGIGRRLGYDAHRLEGVRLGALVHDIGKLAIPNQILSKPGRLTEQEYALVQTHPVRGANIIGDVAFPWPIKQMILQHHERLDGSGYPYGLKGEQILEEAQILAVADIADSMLSHRPYRPALGLSALTKVLMEQRGSCLRADIVDLCLDELSHSQRRVSYVSELPLRPVICFCVNDELPVLELLNMLKQNEEPYVALHNGHWLGVWDVRMLRRHLKLTSEMVALDYAQTEQLTLSSDTPLDEGIKILSEEDHPMLIVDKDNNAIGVLDWKAIAQH